MLTIKGLYRNVQALNTDEVIDKAVDQTLEDLADINRERMNNGVRADGTTMPIYSYISQTVYGYPDTPIKLKATGSFQEKIKVTRRGNILIHESSDSKSGMLQSRYGKEIFGTGVGDYRRQYLKENLRPAVNKELSAAIGIKIGI